MNVIITQIAQNITIMWIHLKNLWTQQYPGHTLANMLLFVSSEMLG